MFCTTDNKIGTETRFLILFSKNRGWYTFFNFLADKLILKEDTLCNCNQKVEVPTVPTLKQATYNNIEM